MKGYCDNIEKRTIENADFRRVLYTGGHLQLVLMTLQPGEEIGAEVHDDRDTGRAGPPRHACEDVGGQGN